MTEPIELKISLNTLPHPGSNVPETPISTDAQLVFHCSTGISLCRYFTEFYSKQPLCTNHYVLILNNHYVPIPSIVLHPQFVGTTDSAAFRGPIARHVCGDFHHFFAHIATEYNGDPILTVADYSRFDRFSGSDRQTRL